MEPGEVLMAFKMLVVVHRKGKKAKKQSPSIQNGKRSL